MRSAQLAAIVILAVSTGINCYAGIPQNQDVENSLRQVYENKLVSLRSPYFGKTLDLDASGVSLNHLIAGPWSTCGLMQVGKVSVTQDEILFDGKRVILARISQEGDQQPSTPKEVHIVPILTGEDIHLRIHIPIVDMQHVNSSLVQVFQGGQLLQRAAKYWKPATTDMKAFRQKTPDAAVGELEGNRPVYLVTKGVVTPPRAIDTADPSYTEAARRANLQGTAKLSIVINEKGFPEMLEIVRGLGQGLDIQALVAVAGWRFDPALRNGKPVAVLVNVEVTFRL